MCIFRAIHGVSRAETPPHSALERSGTPPRAGEPDRRGARRVEGAPLGDAVAGRWCGLLRKFAQPPRETAPRLTSVSAAASARAGSDDQFARGKKTREDDEATLASAKPAGSCVFVGHPAQRVRADGGGNGCDDGDRAVAAFRGGAFAERERGDVDGERKLDKRRRGRQQELEMALTTRQQASVGVNARGTCAASKGHRIFAGACEGKARRGGATIWTARKERRPFGRHARSGGTCEGGAW